MCYEYELFTNSFLARIPEHFFLEKTDSKQVDNILEHILIGIATIGTELSHQQRTTQLHPKRVVVTISYVNSRMRKAANYYPCSWWNRRPALFMAVADIFKD